MTEALLGEGGEVRPAIKIVNNEAEGTILAIDILYRECDPNTVLFLSGGKTPKALYETLAKEQKLKVGAVAMVDDRFGLPMHLISNERSVAETGLFQYLRSKDVPVSLALRPFLSREKTALEYEKIVRGLLKRFPKRIAILGLGVDGHTAGIAPNRPDFKNPLFDPDRQELLVSEFADPKPMSPQGSPVPPYGFGERVTLTLNGLSQMDLLLLMVFGQDKKPGLDLVLQRGKIEDAPVRFLMTEKMAGKTILITDQKV